MGLHWRKNLPIHRRFMNGSWVHRLVGHAAPFETTKTHHAVPIPEGCCYIFEIYMRETLKNINLLDENEGEEGNLIGGDSENNDMSNFTENTSEIYERKSTKKGSYGDSPFDELFASRDAAF